MWAPATHLYDLIAIKKFIAGRGYRSQIDNTQYKRGSLWIVTDRARSYDEAFFTYVDDEFNTHFRYAPNGARATSGTAGWFWVPGNQPGMWLGPGVLED